MPCLPNVIWIVTTQWRAGACGYAGDSNAHTPNLDRLAKQSVNYTQAVTPHPFGPFARAALLTGRPSPQNGVRDYFDPLPAEERTIAHELDARGYSTAFFGKWHLSKRDRAAPLVGDVHAKTIVPPSSRGGFSFWEGFESGFLLNDPWLHGSRLAEPQQFHGYQSDVVCARSAAWLQTQTAPAFLMISLEAPHPPYDAPASEIAPREPNEIALAANVPRGGHVEAKARRELAGYYAHIEATDRAIGRLLESIDEARQNENAPIVVFTSVHGDMHGAHGQFRKGWPYEESIRVPLLIRTRGTPGGEVSSAVSLLDLAGWTIAWADGGSPAIDRAFASISMPSVVALPHQCDRVWRGLRSSSRKLILNTDDSPWLLFDLERDPLEMQNLVSDPSRSGELASLRAQLGLPSNSS